MQILQGLTTRKALKDLVWWTSVVIGQRSYYKDHIANTAK